MNKIEVKADSWVSGLGVGVQSGHPLKGEVGERAGLGEDAQFGAC